jgi:hypothetical protein
MNQSRFKTLAGAAAALATQMALASGAQAKLTEVETGGVTAVENDGVVTEVYELPVDGTLYDVTFSSSSTPGGTPFASYTDAARAAGALGNELKSIGFPPVEYCPPSPASCRIFTRVRPPTNLLAAVLTITSSAFSVGTPGGDTTNGIYAVWTAGSAPPVLTTSVPEPPPAALLGIGMAGVAGARAFRRKKKPGQASPREVNA